MSASQVKVNQKYHLARHSFGVPGEHLVHQAVGRLGYPRVHQSGWDDDQDGARLGLVSRALRQQQAEVAVGDPARLQDLAERVRAELVHCPPPGVPRDGRSR